MAEEKNFNPTGKELFVIYQCPKCLRVDCSMVPPKLKFRLPFFIQCDCCSGWVMYHQAWICEPYSYTDIFMKFVCGDKDIADILKYELEEVTDKLDPDGTVWAPKVFDHGDLAMLDEKYKEIESKKAMYG